MDKAIHVLTLQIVETKKGNQGAGEGFYLPACSCGWKSDIGCSWAVRGEDAARLAWQIAFEHGHKESAMF